MSDAVAAGWALSRYQSVSVVPMIQCRPHGMTNSTLFSVRRISAASEWIRSFGTTRCTPLDARTWNCPRAATSACVSSVQTPVALITCRALTSMSRSLLEVADGRAGDPLALAQEADDPGPGGDQRTEVRRRPGDVHRVPGVVDLAVVVADRADQGVLAQRRRDPQRAAAG